MLIFMTGYFVFQRQEHLVQREISSLVDQCYLYFFSFTLYRDSCISSLDSNGWIIQMYSLADLSLQIENEINLWASSILCQIQRERNSSITSNASSIFNIVCCRKIGVAFHVVAWNFVILKVRLFTVCMLTRIQQTLYAYILCTLLALSVSVELYRLMFYDLNQVVSLRVKLYEACLSLNLSKIIEDEMTWHQEAGNIILLLMHLLSCSFPCGKDAVIFSFLVLLVLFSDWQ